MIKCINMDRDKSEWKVVVWLGIYPDIIIVLTHNTPSDEKNHP